MLPPPAIRGVFRTDERARAAYAEGAGIYRILPLAVCLPADRDDLISLVRWASEHRVPLVPRGAGSAMGGGNVGEGVVVDLTRLPRRLDIRPAERRAVTSANVTLAELNIAADPHRLRLPPDPSSGRFATLGGMVSTNASGARTVRYGSVRRWVVGLELVTAAGEVLELRRGAAGGAGCGRQRFVASRPRWRRRSPRRSGSSPPASLGPGRTPPATRSTTGSPRRDLLDLIIGAEGTLGFVTRVDWRLDPQPAHRAGLRVELRSLDDLVKVVGRAARLRALGRRAARSDVPRPDPPHRGRRRSRRAPRPSCWWRSSATTRAPCGEAVAKASEGVRPWAAAVDTALTAGRARPDSGSFATPRARSSRGCRRTAARSR